MAISTSGVSVPQLGQTIDPSIYGNKEAPKGMSLSDLIDLSKNQLELNKAKETYESDIAQKKAQSRKSLSEATSSELDLATQKQKAIGTGYISKIYSPLVVKAAKDPNSLTPEERQKLVNDTIAWGNQQGKEVGVSSEETAKLSQPYIDIAKNNPGQLQDYLKERHLLGLSSESRGELIAPSATSVAGIPGFQNRMQQTFAPINVNQQPSQAEVGGGFTGAQSQTNIAVPQKIVQEPFPNRANTPYLADTEKPAFDAGVAILKEGREIGDAAQTQLNDIRNARKYIKSATGTALGQGSRSLAKLIAENPDLDSLIKSTAQLQMNAASRFGASTDAARETAAAAAGGADISEKALVRILDNAEADLTRDAKYSAGLQNFVTKRGNTGGTLNAPAFKQAWINNAKDRKLYQLININNNPEFSAAQKQMLRDDLLQHESKSSVEALSKQLKAMKQLEKGD
jgi:hypothetical protein